VSGGLGRESLWLLSSYVVRLVCQVGSFVLVARALGPGDFGLFVSLVALSVVLGRLASMGSNDLLVREAATDGQVRELLGSASVFVLLMSLPLLALIFALAEVFAEHPPALVVLGVGIAHLLPERLISFFTSLHLGTGEVWRSSVVEVAQGLLRLVAAILLFVFGGGLVEWTALYALSFFVLALGVLIALVRGGFSPSFKAGLYGLSGFVRAGWIFALGRLSTTAFSQLDKPMLTWLASPVLAGIYGAAHRVIEAGLLPLTALLAAAYRRHFQAGERGLDESHSFALRMLPLSFATAALSALALWLGAPLLPMVLGSDYAQVVPAVRILAALILLRGVLGPIADALTGAGMQAQRTAIQCIALFVNLLLNLTLIPDYGIHGAITATLVSTLMMCLLASFIHILARRKQGRSLP
jgi:O-antigen/teichoic acid export membrane protein